MGSVPYYVRELPDTTFQDDGHVGVSIDGIDVELVATVQLYRRFLERETRRLAAWEVCHHAKHGVVVGPLRIVDGDAH